MRQIIQDKVIRVIQARKDLEKELEVKIENKGKEITITGTPDKEYIAEQVLEAVGMGFPINVALMIKEDDVIMEKINVKQFTKRNDLLRIRGRIIGTEGKTKKTISHLADCFIEMRDNDIAILGYPENVEIAKEAIISIIRGAKQANAYAYLEHHQVGPIEDFGIKEPKKGRTKKK